MKNKCCIFVVFLYLACSPEAIEHCFTQDGSKETRAYELDEFSAITIRRNIALHITYAETQKIQVEAGKNILNDIEFNLQNGHLEIKTRDLCASGSLNAPYIVHLETPNLIEIRNSSQYKVTSTNTLEFDGLVIISENFNDENGLASGDFDLSLQVERLQLVHAGLSEFNISGEANRFSIEIYSGSGRIFASNFKANEVNILHRGFGDVHIFPIEELRGTLLSTGNLVLYNIPDYQDIEALYTGKIIIQTE